MTGTRQFGHDNSFEWPSPEKDVPPLDRLRLSWGCDGRPRQASVECTPQDRLAGEHAARELAGLPCYDKNPAAFEAGASEICRLRIPWVVAAATRAADLQFPVVTVSGLPEPAAEVRTPVDGLVDEQSVKPQIGFLLGILGSAFNFGGFAYASENRGKLLRAVAPVREQAGKATSQGFDADLDMHADNACLWMTHEHAVSGIDPFINPVQAFGAVHTRDDVPMELLCLDDTLSDLEKRYGAAARDSLALPEFAVRWPDSHDLARQIALSEVPLLVPDMFGNWHGRFHMTNVIGLTDRAEDALRRFKSVVGTTSTIREVRSAPGDLLLYLQYPRDASPPRLRPEVRRLRSLLCTYIPRAALCAGRRPCACRLADHRGR